MEKRQKRDHYKLFSLVWIYKSNLESYDDNNEIFNEFFDLTAKICPKSFVDSYLSLGNNINTMQ